MSRARLLTRSFVCLISGHFLQALGYASLLLLPLYLEHLGASRATIGAVVAVASVSGLLLRPFIGLALDTAGRRRTLGAGTLSMATGLLLLGAVDRVGPLLVASRLLTGAGEAALFTGYFVFAADIVPEARRTQGIALFGLSGLTPLVIGPLTDAWGVQAEGLGHLFPVVGVLVASSLVFLWQVPEPPRPASGERFSPRAALHALRARPLLPVWLVTTLFSGLVAIFMTFVTVAARRRGLPHPAMLWLAYAGAAAVVRTLGSGLPDRVGPRNLIVPAVASYVLAFVVAADARTEAAFWMAGALAGLGHGYGFPVLVTQTVDRTPEHLRGSTFALYTALWALSSLVLTPVFGQIADWSDDATMFSLAALCGVVLLALWVPLETLLARPAGAPSANAPPRC